MLFSQNSNWLKSHCSLTGLIGYSVVQAFNKQHSVLNGIYIGSLVSCRPTNLLKYSRENISLSSHREIEANDISFLVIGYFLKRCFSQRTTSTLQSIFLSNEIRRLHVFYIVFDPRRRCFYSDMFLKSKRFQESGKVILKISLPRMFEVLGDFTCTAYLVACNVSFYT